eukprot:12393171-Alexandrium_andersonii.AAC.1
MGATCMLIQEKYRQAKTPEELYKAIPDLIEIKSANLWEKIKDGVMRFKGILDEDMPSWAGPSSTTSWRSRSEGLGHSR